MHKLRLLVWSGKTLYGLANKRLETATLKDFEKAALELIKAFEQKFNLHVDEIEGIEVVE